MYGQQTNNIDGGNNYVSSSQRLSFSLIDPVKLCCYYFVLIFFIMLYSQVIHLLNRTDVLFILFEVNS